MILRVKCLVAFPSSKVPRVKADYPERGQLTKPPNFHLRNSDAVVADWISVIRTHVIPNVIHRLIHCNIHSYEQRSPVL
ncbi:UNVERIFIED_ORG: hypothetical protein J3D58_002938 [Paenarthrobacter nicotinovorans]